MKTEMKINENLTLFAIGGQAFSTDSYLLAAYLKKRKRAAELGTGCGVCSMLAAARKKFEHITAYELQSELYEAARENIEKNGLAEIITPVCADVRRVTQKEQLDVVFANPPYLRADGKQSPDSAKAIARQELFGGVADFCACASRLLTDGGTFVCVYRPDRMSELFAALRDNRFEPKLVTFVHHNTSRPASIILVEARRGGAPSLTVTKPLILYGADGEMTEDAKKIYDTCSFKDFLT